MSISTGANPLRSRPPRRKYKRMTLEEAEESTPIETSSERSKNPLPSHDEAEITTSEKQKEWHGHDIEMTKDAASQPVKVESKRKDLPS